MSQPERQIRFFANFHDSADFTIIKDKENFFTDHPQFTTDWDTQEGKMTQQEFLNYFGPQYRLTPTSYLIAYEFQWYSDDSANIREKRIRII